MSELTFDVARGEFITLLGPSGSGKTTVLMMLAGFEPPDAGEILLDEVPLARVPPHRREIGVVFQTTALFPHMTVAENIAFPLDMRRVRMQERGARVGRALAMLRLTGLDERHPAQLSLADRQRVALARALVFEPKLVLLDEPLGGLDQPIREEMEDELRRLHRELGVTMLHASRDQAVAMALSDRIAMMAGGPVRQFGTPQALYENPVSAFVARGVGESNLLPGVVEAIDGDEDVATVLLECGFRVQARVGDCGDPGTAAVVVVRPERIAVVAAVAETMGAGALPGQVVETMYRGDHVRLRLIIAAERAAPVEVIVKRPVVAGLAGITSGANVALAWNPFHACTFRLEHES
ncbi:MAG TPA: ABC transporter ATP-binding protein [Acetobacteraceae bacterium]|nr:ABC transporter ATP-binding protein [Acetobacteraceae bacterium]